MNISSTEIQTNLRSETIAAALVALSAILYGFLGCLGIKILQQGFSVSTMLFWRFFIATLWILICTAISRKEKLFEITNRPTLIKTTILGTICYSGGSLFYFLASKQIGTGLSMVIFFSYPMFVVALAWLIEKRALNKYTITALLAIIIGMILIKNNHVSVLNKNGVLFALIASLFYGLYIYGSKYLVQTISSSKQTIVVCLSSAIVFFIVSHVDHTFIYPTTFKSWLYITAIGIVATALPIQLLLAGLKHIHPNKVSILSVLEPVVTLLIGIILLGETTSTIQTIGIVVILLGAICIQFEKKQ